MTGVWGRILGFPTESRVKPVNSLVRDQGDRDVIIRIWVQGQLASLNLTETLFFIFLVKVGI